MNFIRGGEMFTHLRKAKKFTEQRAKFYAAQVYLALRYLHDLGYVYRDLKPENILFDVDGYIKVSDYGLCKLLKPGEKTYSLVGTPDYVSPEVIINKGQTFTTDWWSFGILIYEMIYGSPPFYNRDHEKMFHDILNRELFFDNSKVDSSP
jgi:serine/threonine protein kinase